MIFFLSPRQRQYVMFFTTTWQGFGTVFYELFLTRHGRSASTFFQSIKMYKNVDTILASTVYIRTIGTCTLYSVHKQVNVQEQCMHHVYGYIRTCIQTCTQTTTGLWTWTLYTNKKARTYVLFSLGLNSEQWTVYDRVFEIVRCLHVTDNWKKYSK